MTRAVVVAFHKYTPFGDEFYEPMLTFFLNRIQEYKDEYDKVYIVDSNWGISPETHHLPGNVVVIKVDPHLRYYDAYKKVLPQIKEELVLFMDNDMVVYKPNRISHTFALLSPKGYGARNTDFEPYDVVSIYDKIGTYRTDKLDGYNKFCPYWFATRRELLMKYIDIDWSPDAMPYTETFGLLTEAMLNDGIRPFGREEDKSNCLFDGSQDGEHGKDLGYYHIRAGSTPAYLLSTKRYGQKDTYFTYLFEQPKIEYLRQCAWYQYMGGDVSLILEDVAVKKEEWESYVERFKQYHGLV